MFKYVIGILISVLMVASVQAGTLLDQRVGKCSEEWKEGKHYWMQSISTFHPLETEPGEGHWELNDKGEAFWAYNTLDRRFCRLDGIEGQDIIGAWIAWSDGTHKGWLFDPPEEYEPHKRVEFITIEEFYAEWVWKNI